MSEERRHAPPKSTKLRPRDAWRALKRLDADPDDTAAVFEIIAALTGKCGERLFRRFQHSEVGARVLAEKRDLLATLRDRAFLESLPEGSLGRSYAAFTEREQISADGLVEASRIDDQDLGDEDGARFYDRLRDCHDLEHVVTGYGRDLLGEVAVLALDTAQAWHHGIALIVADVYLQGDAPTRRWIRAAWRRGKDARWLAGADWEALLPMPLGEARAALGLGDPPLYEPVWSAEAPAATQGVR